MGKLSDLKPLVGRWATTIEMLHPDDQRGQRSSATDTYRWLPGENVLVHEVDAMMNGEPVRSIEIYTALASGDLTVRSYSSDGQATDYRAAMIKGKWRINGEEHRFESTVLSPDLIEGKWMLNIDGVWTDWMTVSLQKSAES